MVTGILFFRIDYIDAIEGLFSESYAVGRKPPNKEQAKSNQRDTYRQ